MNTFTNYEENRDRKFVLTIAGTYGRERQPGATVTLVVAYDRLSQTLQQIHRQGGKILGIVASDSSFPTTALLEHHSIDIPSVPEEKTSTSIAPHQEPPGINAKELSPIEPILSPISPSPQEKFSPISRRKPIASPSRSKSRDFWLTPFQIYEKFGVMGSLKKRSQNSSQTRTVPARSVIALRAQRQQRRRPHRQGVKSAIG